MERALLCFNSHHNHRGICIEGTSMHLNCLHDQRKAIESSRKWGKKQIEERMDDRHSRSHTHTRAYREKQKTPSKHTHTHSAKHRYELMCMVKHTEQHTRDLISQSGDEGHQQEENRFKEHLPRSSIHRWGEAAREKAEKSSVLDQWLL